MLAEEAGAPYDRVPSPPTSPAATPEDLTLGDPALWRVPLVHPAHRRTRARALDRDARSRDDRRRPTLRLRRTWSSRPARRRPCRPVEGTDLPGVFVYRTLDDVAALRGWVARRARPRWADRCAAPSSAAACSGSRPPARWPALGAAEHRRRVRAAPHGRCRSTTAAARRCAGSSRRSASTSGSARPSDARIDGPGADGRGRAGCDSPRTATRCDVDVVVFATGVRPRDELARAAGLPTGERGGVVVDDALPHAATPDVWAIGEVACIEGRCLGLVAPGYAMAEVVADRLLGGAATFPGADPSTKLKLLGVDVASFGDAFATTPGALEIVYADPVGGRLQEARPVRRRPDPARRRPRRRRLAPTPRCGRCSAASSAATRARTCCPRAPAPAARARTCPTTPPSARATTSPAGTIRDAVTDHACPDLAAVKACTKAGTRCGSCLPLVKKLVTAELAKAGVTVSTALCEHFALSRAQLFDAVAVSGLRTFSEIVARVTARGRGLRHLQAGRRLDPRARSYAGHVLDGETAPRCRTPTTTSWPTCRRTARTRSCPRIPGGEITPRGAHR